MLKKLAILQAMSNLSSFTVAELAQYASANAATVRTVLARSPAEWFDKEQESSGARGGQPVRMTLNPAGVAGVKEQLENLLLPAANDESEPLGLQAVKVALQKLPHLKGEEREFALAEIKSNLEWAELDLRDSEFANKRQIEAELRRAKETYLSAMGQPRVEPVLDRPAVKKPARSAVVPAYRANESVSNLLTLVQHFQRLTGLIVSYPDGDMASLNRARNAALSLKALYEVGLERDGAGFFEEMSLQSIKWSSSRIRQKAEQLILVFFDSRTTEPETLRQIVRLGSLGRTVILDFDSATGIQQRLPVNKPVVYQTDFDATPRKLAQAVVDIATARARADARGGVLI